MGHLAGIAQLVEHDLAKVGVEGPSPFSRSKRKTLQKRLFLLYQKNSLFSKEALYKRNSFSYIWVTPRE